MDVIIKGFKTIEQAREFMIWYSEQGEQDADMWLDENCPDCPRWVDHKRKDESTKNSITFYVK